MKKQTQVHRKGRTKLANLREAVNPQSRIVQSFSKHQTLPTPTAAEHKATAKVWKNQSGHIFLNSKERRTLSPDWTGYVSEPSLCRGDDGLSNRVFV